MKWVLINKVHINTDLLYSFHWMRGQLWLWFITEECATAYPDPNRENYERLCSTLGVTPLEDGWHG